jgi:hypothetical protein
MPVHAALTLYPPSASADDVKVCAVALNLLHASPSAADASGHTPLHVALQHGCMAAACFIVTRAPATAMIASPERGHPAVVDAVTHYDCSVQFVAACTSADPSLVFKLINGRDLSSWATLAGRQDVTNFIKRNQATLRALTGIEKHATQDESAQRRRLEPLHTSQTSYSLKKTGKIKQRNHVRGVSHAPLSQRRVSLSRRCNCRFS